ncbi:MAG: hypothetical protein WBK55_08790 [Alphaproteobacteria bacterium]
MAVNATTVEDLVSVLGKMGYKFDGHKPGELDEPFVATYKSALKDLVHIGMKTDADLPYNAQVRNALVVKINEEKADPRTMGALAAYSNNKPFTIGVGELAMELASTQEIEAALKEKKFPENLRKPENVAGVIEFFNRSDGYIRAIDKIETELAQRAATAKQTAASKISLVSEVSASSDVPPVPQSTPAPVNAPSDLKGPALWEQLRQQTQKLQDTAVNTKGEKYSGNKNGIYSPDFHNFLKTVEDPAAKQLVQFENEARKGKFTLKVMTQLAWDAKHGVASRASANPQETVTTPSPASAPSEGSVPAAATTTAPQTNTAPPGARPPLTEDQKIAAQNVEEALIKFSEGINAQITERAQKSGMLTGLLFEFKGVPVLSEGKAKDGQFGRDSQESLQAVLKTFQADLELTDDEIYNYTPDVGKKIIKGYPKLKAKISDEQKKELPEDKIKLLVGSLNILKGAGQLPGERIYTDSPIKVNSFGAQILEMIFNFVGKAFPAARGLMDSMLMKLTGGYGYNDLMPEARKDKGLSGDLAQIRKDVAHLTPEQQIEKQYLDALKEAKKNGREGEFKSVITSAVEKMVGLTKDKDTQVAFKSAIDKAFVEAEKKGNTNEAAKSFATTFTKEWTGPGILTKVLKLDPVSTPAPAPKTNALETGAPKADIAPGDTTKTPDTKIDTPVKGTAMTVDPSVSGLPESGALMDRFMKDGDKPLFFHRGDDKMLYVMGVTNDNRLVVEKVSPEDIQALRRAAANDAEQTRKAEISGRTALELLTGERYKNYSLNQIEKMAEKDVINFLTVNPQAPSTKSVPVQAAGDAEESYKAGRGTNFVQQNREINDTAMLRFTAIARPALLTEDTKLGKVRVVILSDRNGFYADRDRLIAEGDKRAVDHALLGEDNPHFRTVDITNDFNRFMKGYTQFCDDHKKQLKDLGERSKFAEYKESLRFNKVDLEKEYPEMAAAIRDPKNGRVYYRDLTLANGKPDIAQFAYYMDGQLNNGHKAGHKADHSLSERPRVSNPVQQATNDAIDFITYPFRKLFNAAARGEEPRPEWTMKGQGAYNFHLPDAEQKAQAQFPAAQGMAEALRQEQETLKQQRRESELEEKPKSAKDLYGENGQDVVGSRADEAPALVATGPKPGVFAGAAP